MPSPRRHTRARARHLAAPLVLAALASLTACGGSAVDVPSVQRLRLANALATAEAVDVVVDGQTVARAVPFRGVSDLALLEAGVHTVTLRSSGTGATLLSTTSNVAANSDVTLVAAGLAGAARAITLVDDPAAPPNLAPQVRLVNAIPGTAGLDLFVGGADFDLAANTAPALAENVAFGATTRYLTVPYGPSSVLVAPAGTRTALVSTPFTVGFEVGRSATFVAAPGVGGVSGPAFFTLDGGATGP